MRRQRTWLSSNLCLVRSPHSFLQPSKRLRSLQSRKNWKGWFISLIRLTKIKDFCLVHRCLLHEGDRWKLSWESLKLKSLTRLSSLICTQTTKSKKSRQFSGTISSHQNRCGSRSSLNTKSNQVSSQLCLKVPTFTSTSTQTLSNSSISTNWWCSKSNKMSFSNKSQVALVIQACLARRVWLKPRSITTLHRHLHKYRLKHPKKTHQLNLFSCLKLLWVPLHQS